MQVLIIEDTVRLAETIGEFLKLKKIDVVIKHDGEEGYYEALLNIYDVIILDLNLPSKDGFSILNDLRRNKIDTPVIILTAKSQIFDKIHGFEYGADDYLTKPFNFDELHARVLALAKRRTKEIVRDIEFNDIALRESTHELVSLKNKNKITLSSKEYNILELLIQANGNVVNKEYLSSKVWAANDDSTYNAVEVYISFLRKKLKELKSNTSITSVRGLGYKLNEETKI